METATALVGWKTDEEHEGEAWKGPSWGSAAWVPEGEKKGDCQHFAAEALQISAMLSRTWSI